MTKKAGKLSAISLAAIIAMSACGSKPEKTAAIQAEPAAPAAQPPASQPVPQPAPGQPAAQPAPGQPAAPAGAPVSQPAPSAASVPPQTPVESAASAPAQPAQPPPPPPAPKKYVLSAGTPISVRTLSNVSTKEVKSGNEFEASLESPLVVDGHTVAKRGATVIGRVANADKGGRVKGKASLTLSLARLHLTNGRTVTIHTNSVTQQAKSDTGKNLKRTGIATGVGAAIGAIAGGGKGAAIGAGVGAGAGVATNLATRGPAAAIPPETVLNFSLTQELVVTEKH